MFVSTIYKFQMYKETYKILSEVKRRARERAVDVKIIAVKLQTNFYGPIFARIFWNETT